MRPRSGKVSSISCHRSAAWPRDPEKRVGHLGRPSAGSVALAPIVPVDHLPLKNRIRFTAATTTRNQAKNVKACPNAVGSSPT